MRTKIWPTNRKKRNNVSRLALPGDGRRILPTVALVLLAGTCALLTAQDKKPVADYALIYGTVWGPDNTPVAGVPITIRRSTDKKPKWELVSDRRGEFAQRVPPGKDEYIVQANIKTQNGQPKPEIKVQIDGNERQDVGLHLTSADLTKK